MNMRNFLLIPLLVLSLFVACAIPAWVNNVESIAKSAAPIAGAIVSIVVPGSAPLVVIVETAFNALTGTLDTYKASPTATTLQAVQSAVAAVNTNVAQLEAGAQVKNPDKAAQLKAIVALLNQAVTEIASQVPLSTTKGALRLPRGYTPKGMTGADFTKAYNAIAAGDSSLPQLK